jgi:hypothetical protein
MLIGKRQAWVVMIQRKPLTGQRSRCGAKMPEEAALRKSNWIDYTASPALNIMMGKTLAQAAGLGDHCWTLVESLTYNAAITSKNPVRAPHLALKRSKMMNSIFSITMLVLLIAQGAPTDVSQSGEAKPNQRRDDDNSLRVARIVNGETWYPNVFKGRPGTLSRISANGTAQDYFLTVFPDPFSPLPRWQVKGGYFYAVSLAPGSDRMGYHLMRVRLTDLKKFQTKQEMQKAGAFFTWPPTDTLDLWPLNRTYAAQHNLETIARWDEPVYYDFSLDEQEKLTLVIITEGKLDVWELESRDYWDTASASSSERKDPSKLWRRTGHAPAPFSARFVADNQGGPLSLTTETGELWQSNDRSTFSKMNAAVRAKTDGPSLLIEDTDKRQIWLSRDSENEAITDEQLHLVKGENGAPSDRVRTAVQKIADRKR